MSLGTPMFSKGIEPRWYACQAEGWKEERQRLCETQLAFIPMI